MKFSWIVLSAVFVLAGTSRGVFAQDAQSNWYIVSTTYVLPTMAVSDIEYYKIGMGNEGYAQCMQEIDTPVLGVPPGTPRQLQDGAIILETAQCKPLTPAQEAKLPPAGEKVYFHP